MVENGGLDLVCHPVGMRASGSRQPVDEAIGAIGMEVAPDLVELLTSRQVGGLVAISCNMWHFWHIATPWHEWLCTMPW